MNIGVLVDMAVCVFTSISLHPLFKWVGGGGSSLLNIFF